MRGTRMNNIRTKVTRINIIRTKISISVSHGNKCYYIKVSRTTIGQNSCEELSLEQKSQ